VLEQRWTALRHSTLEAYRAGRVAAPLLSVVWEDLWEQPLERVRTAYGIRPIDRARFA
jgi:ubiquinone biosynthesis protein Coq4